MSKTLKGGMNQYKRMRAFFGTRKNTKNPNTSKPPPKTHKPTNANIANASNSYKLKSKSFTLNNSEQSNYCCLIGPFGKMYISSFNIDLNNKIKEYFDEKDENLPAIAELRRFDDSLHNSWIEKKDGVIRLHHALFIFSNKEDDITLQGNFIIQENPKQRNVNLDAPVVTSLSLLKRDEKLFSLEPQPKSPRYYIELPFNGNNLKMYIKSMKIIKLISKLNVSSNSENFNGNYKFEDTNMFVTVKKEKFYLNYNFELIQRISPTQELSDLLMVNGPFLIHTE